jgi:hypothetical protein
MATLSSDHGSVQLWGSVTTCPDDHRIELATPLDPTSDNNNRDPSYAHLLYQAFKNAPKKTMKICDIYDWFQKNAHKANKMSIRYNLSRNAARLLPSLPARH